MCAATLAVPLSPRARSGTAPRPAHPLPAPNPPRILTPTYAPPYHPKTGTPRFARILNHHLLCPACASTDLFFNRYAEHLYPDGPRTPDAFSCARCGSLRIDPVPRLPRPYPYRALLLEQILRWAQQDSELFYHPGGARESLAATVADYDPHRDLWHVRLQHGTQVRYLYCQRLSGETDVLRFAPDPDDHGPHDWPRTAPIPAR